MTRYRGLDLHAPRAGFGDTDFDLDLFLDLNGCRWVGGQPDVDEAVDAMFSVPSQRVTSTRRGWPAGSAGEFRCRRDHRGAVVTLASSTACRWAERRGGGWSERVEALIDQPLRDPLRIEADELAELAEGDQPLVHERADEVLAHVEHPGEIWDGEPRGRRLGGVAGVLLVIATSSV